MSDFESRLSQAIQRGRQSAQASKAAAQRAALTEEQLRRLHSQYRLELAEHIESCLSKMGDHFPGFRLESVVGDRGWGAAAARDDVQMASGKASTVFSRIEVTVRPYSTAQVLEIGVRGTIRNKEVLQRSLYHPLTDAQVARLIDQIDLWLVEYAELYAARG
ncbi:MAG: hypothetical protein SFX18_00130 [Pirellulales bacterium]|nr:hypothetical protein [Pirellulales bacterium]